MDLGLASLTDAQLYELLQETLLAISGRCKQAYMLEACQTLISNEGKLLSAAKQEFYAQVESEQKRQVQEIKVETLEKFRAWVKEQTVIPVEVKRSIIDTEYDRLMDEEIKHQVQKIREFVRVEFPSMIKPEDRITEAEELIVATDVARGLLEARRLEQADKLAKEAATKAKQMSGSAADKLREIGRLIGNTSALLMTMTIRRWRSGSDYDLSMVVTHVDINFLNGGSAVLHIDFTISPPRMLSTILPNATLDPIYTAVCDYINHCADSSKLTEIIPVYKPDATSPPKLGNCTNCGHPPRNHTIANVNGESACNLCLACPEYSPYDYDDDDNDPF